jgi:hypothetical protein
MKTIVILIITILFSLKTNSQGTLQFYAELRPNAGTTLQAIQVGDAWLILTGNQLSGNIRFSTGTLPTAARVIDFNGVVILETSVFTNPFPDSQSPGAVLDASWSTTSLSDLQVQALESGQWSAVIPTSLFPQGEIAGQFQLVPEPATWSLFTIGLLGIVAFPRLRNYPITIGAGILSGDKK